MQTPKFHVPWPVARLLFPSLPTDPRLEDRRGRQMHLDPTVRVLRFCQREAGQVCPCAPKGTQDLDECFCARRQVFGGDGLPGPSDAWWPFASRGAVTVESVVAVPHPKGWEWLGAAGGAFSARDLGDEVSVQLVAQVTLPDSSQHRRAILTAWQSLAMFSPDGDEDYAIRSEIAALPEEVLRQIHRGIVHAVETARDLAEAEAARAAEALATAQERLTQTKARMAQAVALLSPARPDPIWGERVDVL